MARPLKELLFKPKWENKKASVRLMAVSHSRDPRLIAKLDDIARNDDDAAVRLAALRRVTDIYILMCAWDDPDSSIAELARQRFLEHLCGNREPIPALDERKKLVSRIEDPDMVLHLATNADEAVLRRVALERISAQGKLGNIAIDDPDPDVRRAALEKIDRAATLKRVAAASRTSDKTIYKLASDRIRQLSNASSAVDDRQAIEPLCVGMEALTRSGRPQHEKSAELDRLDASWQRLKGSADPILANRYRGARAIVLEALAADPSHARERIYEKVRNELVASCEQLEAIDAQGRYREIDQTIEHLRSRFASLMKKYEADDAASLQERFTAAIDQATEQRDAALDAEPVPAPLLKLADRAEAIERSAIIDAKGIDKLVKQWDKTYASLGMGATGRLIRHRFEGLIAQARDKAQSQATETKDGLAKLEQLLQDQNKALDDGDLSAARSVHFDIHGLLRNRSIASALRGSELSRDLQTSDKRLFELRDWQHWANNKIRHRLIEHAQELLGSGLHPDALMARIRELRDRWKQLDESERLQGENRRPAIGLWHRFRAATGKAIEPAKPYFEKRHEIRESTRGELEQLCVDIDQAIENRAEPEQLARMATQARRSMHRLNEVEPKHRSALANRIRGALDRLDGPLKQHDQTIELRKKRIIEEVEKLLDADLDQAISGAKDAQKRWRAVGNGDRKTGQKQWKAFRAICDQIFARLDADRNARNQQEAQARDQAQQVIQAAQQVDLDDPDQISQEIGRLNGQWQQLDRPARDQVQAFLSAIDALEKRRRQSQEKARAARQGQMDGLLQKALDAEWAKLAGGTATSDVPEADQYPEFDPVDPRLQAVRDRIKAANETDSEALQSNSEQAVLKAQELVMRLEFLAGIESPDAFRQQRMDYQVQRLADRMSGEHTQGLDEELKAIEIEWFACGPIPTEAWGDLSRRYKAARKALS